jgi:glycosyltransferase involved in cell wall biosynthesis
MIQDMVNELSPHVVYNIISTRYPVPEVQWKRMSFTERFDEKFFGGSSIRDVISRFDPDIIYSDSPLYASQFKLVSFLSGRRRPLVLHLRGDLWREHRAVFASASIRRRLLLMQQFSYDWTAVELAAKITPICRWLQGVVRHYVPRKRCEVVYQGVDPKQFRPQVGFEVRKPAIAILQNHSILPKVQGLLNFKAVLARLPQVHFYIAEGEAWAQQFLNVVKGHFSDLPNVHFVKDITNAEGVSKMLTACDCYVLASGLDCCPTTVLEASLLERPVLASRVGGVPEIIMNGYTGWSVDNDNLDEWVNRIEMLVKDARLSRRLGRQGRKWVSEKFGWATIAKQVEHLLLSEVA